MLTIVINLLTFVLIIVSLFMLLVILMQRANSNAGMGSAFGGGVTESTFGAETTNILERATKWSALAFFILALVLYLLFMSREGAKENGTDSDLPDIPVVTEAAPAETSPVATEAASIPAEVQEAANTVSAEAVEAIDEVTAEALDLTEEPIPSTLPETEQTATP